MRTFKRLLLVILFPVFLFGLLEVLLRVVDPWGIQQAMATSRMVQIGYTIDGDRVLLTPGHFDSGAGWSYTVGLDHRRVVPASKPNGVCTLAIVGDSVAFGWGVNDNETFANLIAQAHPEWRVINYGVSGYNRDDIRQLLPIVQADVVVWLTIENDDNGPLISQQVGGTDPLTPLLLERYWRGFREALSYVQAGPLRPSLAYQALVHEALAQGVQVWAFQGNPLPNSIQGVQWLPEPTHTISRGDPHPNAVGHREIAEIMLSALQCDRKQEQGDETER